MEDPVTVLVVILSVTLTIFLIVAILFLIALLKFVSYLRIVAGKAEHIVENVDTATTALKNVAGPLAAGKFFANIIDMVTKYKKGGR